MKLEIILLIVILTIAFIVKQPKPERPEVPINRSEIFQVGGDVQAPQWSNNQSYTPTNYEPNTLSEFNITWTDNAEVDTVFIEQNWTSPIQNLTMTNNTYGGSIYNYSVILPAGTFYWKSYANDTSGNWNVSDTWIFTIGKASNPVNLYLNGTKNDNRTYTYPESINATGTSEVGTVYLYRDGASVSNPELIRLGNGTYTYKVNATGNQNYTDNSTGLTFYAFVNKGIPDVKTFIDDLPSNKTVTYPTSATIKGNSTTTITPPTFNLYIADISLGPGNPVSSSIEMGAGTHNVVYNTSGNANWTSTSNSTLYLIVNKGDPSPNMGIFLNDLASNLTITYPDTATARANETNQGDSDLVYRLWRDESNIINGSDVSDSTRLGNATYRFRYNTTGGTNYTSGSASPDRYLFVLKGSLDLSISSSQNPATYPATTTVTGTETNVGDSDVTYKLFRDEVLKASGINPGTLSETIKLGVGNYIYKFNATGGTNWTANDTGVDLTQTININTSTQDFMNLTINGTESNKWYFYPNPSNATGWYSTDVFGDQTITFTLYRTKDSTVTTIGTSNPISDVQTNLAVAVHNYTYYTAGNQNYSSAKKQYNLTIEEITKEEGAPIQWDAEIEIPVSFNKSITLNVSGVGNYTNIPKNASIPTCTLSGNATLYYPNQTELTPDVIDPTNSYVQFTIDYLNASSPRTLTLVYNTTIPKREEYNETITEVGVSYWRKYVNITAGCIDYDDVQVYTGINESMYSYKLYDNTTGLDTDVTTDPDYNVIDGDLDEDGLPDQLNWTTDISKNTKKKFYIKGQVGVPVTCEIESKEITTVPIVTGVNINWNWTIKCSNVNPSDAEISYKIRVPLDGFNFALDDVGKASYFDAYGKYVLLERTIPANAIKRYTLSFSSNPVTAEACYYYPPDRDEVYYVDEYALVEINVTIKNWGSEDVNETIKREIPIIYGKDLKVWFNNSKVDSEAEVTGKYLLEVDKIEGNAEKLYSINFTIPTCDSELLLERPEPERGLKVRVYKITGVTPYILTEVHFIIEDIEYNETQEVYKVSYPDLEELEALNWTSHEGNPEINLGAFTVAMEKYILITYGRITPVPDPLQKLVEFLNKEIFVPIVSVWLARKFRVYEVGIISFSGFLVSIFIYYYLRRKEFIAPFGFKLPKMRIPFRHSKKEIIVEED